MHKTMQVEMQTIKVKVYGPPPMVETSNLYLRAFNSACRTNLVFVLDSGAAIHDLGPRV